MANNRKYGVISISVTVGNVESEVNIAPITQISSNVTATTTLATGSVSIQAGAKSFDADQIVQYKNGALQAANVALHAIMVVLPSGDTSGATDYANMMAAQAKVAALGGEVRLQSGRFYINGTIPLSNGVKWRGSGWTITSPDIPDSQDINPLGGTWVYPGTGLEGAFHAFAYNAVDAAAPYATQKQFSDDSLYGAGVYDLGIYRANNGIQIGANYKAGMQFCKCENVIAIDCYGWGFRFENYMHAWWDRLYAMRCRTGQFWFRSSATSPILMPANSYIGEIYGTPPGGSATARGVVISTTNNTRGGIYNADGIQCNKFGEVTVSQAATMSGSNNPTRILVPDYTAFPVGMPVTVSASVNGFTANQIYIIRTSQPGYVTLTHSRRNGGTDIAATGSAAVNLIHKGWPCLEVVSEDGLAPPCLSNVGSLDLEVGGTTKALLDYARLGNLDFNNFDTLVSIQDVVARNTICASFNFRGTVNLDFDQISAQLCWILGSTTYGPNTLNYSKNIGGLCGASNASGRAHKLNLAMVSSIERAALVSIVSANGTGVVNRAEWPIGTVVSPMANTALSLNVAQAGTACYTGSTATTWTLPVIAADGAASSVPKGVCYEICNAATASVNLTLAANTGQYFNGNASKTSYVLPQYASITVRSSFDGTNYFWQVVWNNGAT